jgi:hypothetical protein
MIDFPSARAGSGKAAKVERQRAGKKRMGLSGNGKINAGTVAHAALPIKPAVPVMARAAG